MKERTVVVGHFEELKERVGEGSGCWEGRSEREEERPKKEESRRELGLAHEGTLNIHPLQGKFSLLSLGESPLQDELTRANFLCVFWDPKDVDLVAEKSTTISRADH